VNARHGNEPGVLLYTHISDQFGPFYTKVTAANTSEAAHVLDGLLYHDTGLAIEEHYTDTGGVSDPVFDICHLFGFRFDGACTTSMSASFTYCRIRRRRRASNR
jgi:TnpA family transposase